MSVAAQTSIAVGVTGGDAATAASRFVHVTGVTPAVEGWYSGWAGEPAFDAARASAARARGSLPMVTWEPWDPSAGADAGADQPAYALARIAAGDFDAYVTAWARQVRAWGGPVVLRFAHELDAPHYPWSVGVNGNTAADAVAAWRHVHTLVEAQGADVIWAWCVNVHADRGSAYAPLYPGDDVVDWLAVDGYNGGTALPWGGWRSPAEVFGQSVDDLRALSPAKPLLITETASAEAGGDKAAWIHELFGYALDARIRGLVWFDEDKETDWRITSSPAAAAAFRAELAVPGRLGPLPGSG
jgi:hypothetical protein